MMRLIRIHHDLVTAIVAAAAAAVGAGCPGRTPGA
jgi:hypothetical protein